MEMYKKPIMKIVELEKVDVLTCSSPDFPNAPCNEGHGHSVCKANGNICHVAIEPVE